MSHKGGYPGPEDPSDDRADWDLAQLDNELDREELRRRYYGLLQELRVVLPGVQVLLAFLLTVPFAQRFGELDEPERVAYGIAMVSALLSVVCLVSPAVIHRLADRRARTIRLRLGIGFTLAGLALLAVSLVTALWCVAFLVYGSTAAWLISVPVAVAIVAIWVVVPLMVRAEPPARP